jgi:hypothetical protein
MGASILEEANKEKNAKPRWWRRKKS